MTGARDTYPCPWCDTERPRKNGPCPECGHVDKASFLPRHVHGLPGGNAIADIPATMKVLIVFTLLWVLLTLAFIFKYG
jgi:hypothetical protein